MKFVFVLFPVLLTFYAGANAQIKTLSLLQSDKYEYCDSDKLLMLPVQTITCDKEKIDAFAYVYYRRDITSGKYTKICMNILLWPKASGSRNKNKIYCSGKFKRQNSTVLHNIKCPAKVGIHVFEGEADVFLTAATKKDDTNGITGRLKYKVTFDADNKNACKADLEIVKAAWTPADTKFDESSRYGFHINRGDGRILGKHGEGIKLITYNSGNEEYQYLAQVDFISVGASGKKSSAPDTFVTCDSMNLLVPSHASEDYSKAVSKSIYLYKRKSPYVVYQTRMPIDYSIYDEMLSSGETLPKKYKRIENGSVETRATCKVGFVNNETFFERATMTTLLHY